MTTMFEEHVEFRYVVNTRNKDKSTTLHKAVTAALQEYNLVQWMENLALMVSIALQKY